MLWGPVGDDARSRLCARWVAESGKPVPEAFRPVGFVSIGAWGGGPRWVPTWGTHDTEVIVPAAEVPEPDRI